MTLEFLAFINFKFKISKTTTKVIVGDRVQDEVRYVLNWRDYCDYLINTGCASDLEERPFYSRYSMPRQAEKYFDTFLEFQNEMRRIIESISNDKCIPVDLWKAIFKEAEKVEEIVKPEEEIDRPVTRDMLQSLKFKRSIVAETYRQVLFSQLKDLIITRKIFRLKQCPECNAYFLDRSRGGTRKYCRNEICGRSARSRIQKMKRAEKIMALKEKQPVLNFSQIIE